MLGAWLDFITLQVFSVLHDSVHGSVIPSCKTRSSLSLKGKWSLLAVFEDVDFWFIFCCHDKCLFHGRRFEKQCFIFLLWKH